MAHSKILTLIAAITFLFAYHNAIGSTIANSKSNNTITVEGTSYAKLNSAYDILKKTPGVTINKNNVPIVNSTHEAVVYVNNRKVNDISELKHISASNIKNITVIANPSAQYSGEQQAVILLETIKKLDKGYSIYDQLQVSYNRHMGIQNDFSIDITRKQLKLNGALFYNSTNTDYDIEEFYETFTNTPSGTTILDTRDYYKMYQNIKTREIATKLEGEWSFNNNHKIILRYEYYTRGKFRKENNPQINKFYQRGSNGIIDLENPISETYTYKLDNRPIDRHSIHMAYEGKVKGWRLGAYADFVHNFEGQYAKANPLDNPDIITKDLFFEQSQQNYNIKAFANHSLGKGEVMFGSEMNFIRHTNFYDDYTVSKDRTHAFITDNTYALFADVNQTLSWLKIEAGIRYDHRINSYSPYMDDESRQEIIDMLTPYNVNKYLSHNYITTNISLSNTVGAVKTHLTYKTSYVKPFKKYQRISADELDNINNILLKTEFQHSLSIESQWRWLKLNLYYTHYKNPIFETMNSLENYNGPDYNAIGIQTTLNHKIGFWNPILSLYLHKQWLNMETPDGKENLKKPRLSTMFVNSFNLPLNITLDLTAYWETKGARGSIMNYTHFFNLDASLHKDFFKGKLSVSINGENILNTACIDATRYTLPTDGECGGDKKELPSSVIIALKLKL